MCLKYLTEVCIAWKDPEYAIFYVPLVLFLQLITQLRKDTLDIWHDHSALCEAVECRDLWYTSFIFSLLDSYHEFKVEDQEWWSWGSFCYSVESCVMGSLGWLLQQSCISYMLGEKLKCAYCFVRIKNALNIQHTVHPLISMLRYCNAFLSGLNTFMNLNSRRQ